MPLRLSIPSDAALPIWRPGFDRVWVWDIKKLEPGSHFDVPEKVTWASISRDGNALAISGQAGLVQLWNCSQKVPILATTHAGHVGSVQAIALSPDNTRLATGCCSIN